MRHYRKKQSGYRGSLVLRLKKTAPKKGAAKMRAGDYCIVSLFSVSFCGLS